MSNSVRIGVAGAGVFGSYHAAKFAAHEKSVLTGVFDVDPVRARSLAEKFGARAFDDLGEFLAHADAVVVTAPATCHFDLAAKALEAGRHAFVEKPLTLTVEDAEALIALAASKTLVLQAGHQERYVFDAVGLFNRDRAPLKIDCVRCGPPSGRCEDVSVVFDLMVHDIDLVRRLTQSEIKTLSAEGDAVEAFAEMVLDNGTLVSMKASRRASAPQRRMTLVYDDGVIEFDFVNRMLANSTMAALGEAFRAEGATLALTDPLAYGAEMFLKSILQGSAPAVTGEDGRDAVAWAGKIEQAAGVCAAGAQERERLRA